jgi:C4-type Zn-finger protein
MTEWKNVVPMVVETLGTDEASHACMLEFLRVLPEEVTEGRKITLTVCGPKSTSLMASAPTLQLRANTRVRV